MTDFTNLHLAWPLALAALPLPILVWLALPRARRTPLSALRVPFFAALSAAGQGVRQPRPLKGAIAVLAWTALVLAAARPQLAGEPLALAAEGRDLMLAVDISGSMAEEDMIIANRRVDRLTAVKAVAGDFIERRVGDRVGLILFGSQAYTQTPLTFDRDTARTQLFESVVGLAGKETAIGDAIGLAVKRLADQPEGDRVLILLTDGANTTGQLDPRKAAEIAAIEGVRIHTIGIGGERGLFGLRGAEIDEATLRAIAEATGGSSFRARDLAGLQEIYGLLDRLELRAADERFVRPVDEFYGWPLGTALTLTGLLALSGLMPAGSVRGWSQPRVAESVIRPSSTTSV